jgi:hypothetical protein
LPAIVFPLNIGKMLPTYVLIIIFISMASAITNYKNEMGDIGTHPGRPFEFQHIHGLVAAVYTPFNADGSLNLNQVANQVVYPNFVY